MSINISKYKGNSKGLAFILAFRSVNYFCTHGKMFHIIGIPVILLYRLLYNWILCIDIHEATKIGKDFVIWHGFGIVIHPDTIIGDFVTIHQSVTIGNAKHGGKPPRIGSHVDIGAGSLIIGDIKVGNNIVIGAGSVVTKDVPDNVTVVGNPAHIIKKND